MSAVRRPFSSKTPETGASWFLSVPTISGGHAWLALMWDLGVPGWPGPQWDGDVSGFAAGRSPATATTSSFVTKGSGDTREQHASPLPFPQ